MSVKNILIAGGSGGLGSQLAPLLEGDNVILHYNTHEPETDGFKVRADITKPEEVERMVDEIIGKYGTIDVLINATGVSINGFAHKMTYEDWKTVIDVNLVGAFNLIRAVLPHMRNNNYGRIITISSVVFQRPVLGTSAYSASKAAQIGLTRTVALENVNKGITCNCIALGYFNAGILYDIPENLREEIRKAIPMQRFGEVRELFRTIRYLIDDEYITGQVISQNGGIYMA